MVHNSFGVAMPLQLSTCIWHSVTCISELHSSSPPPVTTPSPFSFCNECLAQSVKQPFRVIKPWEVPGVRLRVSNNRSGKSNNEFSDVVLVLGSSTNSSLEKSQNNTDKHEKEQLLDWKEIEKGRPWFTPNRPKDGQDRTSSRTIQDAKGQAPWRQPPDGKQRSLTPPTVIGGMHTFFIR